VQHVPNAPSTKSKSKAKKLVLLSFLDSIQPEERHVAADVVRRIVVVVGTGVGVDVVGVGVVVDDVNIAVVVDVHVHESRCNDSGLRRCTLLDQARDGWHCGISNRRLGRLVRAGLLWGRLLLILEIDCIKNLTRAQSNHSSSTNQPTPIETSDYLEHRAQTVAHWLLAARIGRDRLLTVEGGSGGSILGKKTGLLLQQSVLRLAMGSFVGTLQALQVAVALRASGWMFQWRHKTLAIVNGAQAEEIIAALALAALVPLLERDEDAQVVVLRLADIHGTVVTIAVIVIVIVAIGIVVVVLVVDVVVVVEGVDLGGLGTLSAAAIGVEQRAR
jgi:hypothetical protein